MSLMDTTLVHAVTRPLGLVVVVVLLLLGCVSAQEDDFSTPIKCFSCNGKAEGSDCSDPIDVKRTNTSFLECEHGVCLKMTKYVGENLHMVRTCSSKLNFHLTMIDGVCRTERNGNGYLCMCGKNLCNSSPPGTFQRSGGLRKPGILLISALLAGAMFINSFCHCNIISRGAGLPGLGIVFPVR